MFDMGTAQSIFLLVTFSLRRCDMNVEVHDRRVEELLSAVVGIFRAGFRAVSERAKN